MRFFLVLLSISCLAFSQKSKIDSVRNEINKKPSFKLLNNLAWEYSNSQPDSLNYYNSKSLQYLKTVKEKGQYLLLKSIGLLLHENLDLSRTTALETLKISEVAHDFSTSSSAYNVLSKIFNYEGNFVKSEYFSKKSFLAACETKDAKKILKPLINYGSSLMQNGKIDEGIKIYQSAEKYFYKGSETEQGYIYFNFARVYIDKNQFPEALFNLSKAQKKYELIKYTDNLNDIHIAYAEIYTSLKDRKKALFHLKNAKKFAKNQSQISDVSFVTAQLYTELNEISNAKTHLQNALKINEEMEDFSRLGEDYLLLAKILKKQNNLQEEALYLKKAIKI